MRRKICSLMLYRAAKFSSFNSSLHSRRCFHLSSKVQALRSSHFGLTDNFSNQSSVFTPYMPWRCLSSTCKSSQNLEKESSLVSDSTSDEIEPIDSWEDEDEAEAKIGDGGDGGGVVFQDCSWGGRALAIANEVLLQFGDVIKLFAFKTSPQGYIYVRLDKLSNDYGCPSMEELESFSRLYKAKLDEIGERGDIPGDLALEVSSPGAERLLKVPDDLDRFKDMVMRVDYVENADVQCPIKNGVFLLESVEPESSCCIWKLADVKENRDPSAKGRPLSRKQKDWRLKLACDMCQKVTLYLD